MSENVIMTGGIRAGKNGKIKSLTCCCCGEGCKGRQWWNRDTGFGLCNKCADWIEPKETPETMKSYYGIKGIHYYVFPSPKPDGVQ